MAAEMAEQPDVLARLAARAPADAAAVNTRRAETWPRMPARRAARTTAGAETDASSAPRLRASAGSVP